jgi:Cupin domain
LTPLELDPMTTKTYDPVVVDLDAVDWKRWDKPGANGRVKLFNSNGKRLRLLELPPGFNEENWCVVGHQGYVFEGRFIIQLDDREFQCGPGMAFSIPDGVRHRSRGAQDSRTLVFVVDEMIAQSAVGITE